MKINNIKALIFENTLVERFVYCVLLATLFTTGLCHWILDVEYYEIIDDKSLATVNLGWVFVVCVPICIFYLIRKKQIQFDMALVILVQTFIFIGILDMHYERYSLAQYAWILPTAYIIGKLAVGTDVNKENTRILQIYLVLAGGILITTLLDFAMNFVDAPTVGYMTEGWPSFWTRGLQGNRCTYEFGFVLVTAATGYALIVANKYKLILIPTVVLNVVIQALVISVEGRENRLLLPINLFIVGVLYYYDHRKKMSAKMKKVIHILVAIFIAFIAFAVISFFNNWFGLYTRYLHSNWHSSGGVFTNVRFRYDINGFKNMIMHPVEDYSTLYKVRQPHSMLLEYGRVFGFSVWGLLTIFRLLIIKDMIMLAVNKSDRAWVKYILVPAFISVNLYHSMELNGYAHRYMWMVGLLISGMIRGWLENEKRSKL